MIKTMLKPLFKRFIGLFISMAFVSMLSIGLLCAFASTLTNIRRDYRKFLNESSNVDAQITFDFMTKSGVAPLIKHAPKTYDEHDEGSEGVEGVDKIDFRFAIDMFLQKDDGRNITARLYSYDEEEDMIFHRKIIKKTDETKEGTYSISVVRKFAEKNNFNVGDTFKVGFFGLGVTCYIQEIVETPEGIYPRTNDYIWSDNRDFGYLYIQEMTLNNALIDLASQIQKKVKEDESFLPEYREYIEAVGLLIPDISTLEDGTNYAGKFCNQILVAAKPGYTQEQLLKNIDKYFEEEYITPKSETLGDNLPYRIYMRNALKQINIVTIFIPIFFYSVTMIVIGLFMNQIIKTMTPEIGVLMSIGIDKKSIMLLYMIFSGLMSLTAGILGIGAGYGLNAMLMNTVRFTYSISSLSVGLNPLVTVLGIVALIIFSELATLISCANIFRITPKDATLSNEAKRKPLPKWLDNLINKAPMNLKLATNSIAQNPRRFFVSSFSIFASFVLILLSSFFFVSKNEMISQTVNRRLAFDCQVYLTSKDQSLKDIMLSYESVDEVEGCYYTYMKTHSSKVTKDVFIECLAIPTDSSMIKIPDKNGKGQINIQSTGVVLPTSDAERLKVKKGDTIYFNNNEIVVSDISYQYFHPIAYLSQDEMVRVANDLYVSTFLVNVNNENAFLQQLTTDYPQCLTVFTSSLSNDLKGIFDSINIFIVIMIAFSLGMSFLILSIMSQNALLETKRQVSVFRAIGFTIGNVSNMWTFTSALQLVLGSLIAVPAGAGFSMLLFKLCSSSTQTYPFIFDFRVVLFAFAFIFLVVLACHLISMFTIKKWCLADNLRSRE